MSTNSMLGFIKSVKLTLKNQDFCQIDTGSYLIGVFVISGWLVLKVVHSFSVSYL